ncbi:MAG: glycosyltransferase [Clostridia bacterium]|nr:glycosyltransferase [Clostridia bacterium]
MKDLVSVVVPVYNVEKYLGECIDSVLAQTYENWEMILVDDGSTDGSGAICDAYAAQDPRIQVLHRENGGLSEARNTGLAHSSGEYIYFLDSDDRIISEALAELVGRIEEENADIVYFDAVSFLDGSDTSEMEQRYIRRNAYPTDDGHTVLGRLQDNREYHSAVPLLFMRRSFLSEKHLTFSPGILYEDMLFTYQMYCRAERAAYLNKALYHRRYRSNSIMTSAKTRKNFESACEVYRKVREFSEDEGIMQNPISKKYISRCAFNGLNLYRQISRRERKECRDAYKALEEDILKYDAFHNKALYMRCYGTAPWFVYKVWEKLFARNKR